MKLGFRYKLRSGALQFVVFIAVLVALLLSGLVLYAYSFVFVKEQSKATIENICLSDSGIAHMIQSKEVISDTLLLDLNNGDSQIIKGHISQWGIFQKAFVETRHRKKRFVKTAIIGSIIDSESPTLYLQETNNPLTLVGNTKIRGNVLVPLQGVRSGYIAGESYYGSSLIYGSSRPSSDKLPDLDKLCVDQLYLYSKEFKRVDTDFAISSSKKMVHSFKEHTKSIYSKREVVLEDVWMTGNIIIKSDSLIVVKKSATIKDLILIAPVVEIEDGVVGVFQVVASQRITIGKNCRLNYPSAIVLAQEDLLVLQTKNRFDNKIFIDEGTAIKGSICYLRKGRSDDFFPQIVVEKTAWIKGQVYCMGNFELRGKVSGTVISKQFIANQSGSIYMNHIYGGIIENENIPDHYGGILLEKQDKTLIKWLY
ncbi:hypothetical protein ACI6PS_07955 [Flavobacterium sp. PLA-1-15]|uniref:hypothetical protein n=1 Tax=Flavobacterium sp. PLA-1-15 TaxID=3380533 RepID=UPI003B77B9CE